MRLTTQKVKKRSIGYIFWLFQPAVYVLFTHTVTSCFSLSLFAADFIESSRCLFSLYSFPFGNRINENNKK
ncbi:Uncharacterized protein APZ42_024830 [Daphnia magna]|uniref:Uncharacterized protein n=1 Tax=Daphnia magna TaxID=35525 RepID=A0A164TQC9_9CRUS|nr:Uncharacterized protein APZ42_024830 [Daphnia magna]